MTQMTLAEHDHMIEALVSDRADQTFDIAVLPRRSRRCRSVANAHRSDAARKRLSVDPVPITNERVWCALPTNASVTCWAIHSALGCAVTPSHRMRLRSCRRTSNPYSNRKEIVGTTNRSIEAIPSAWFRRNVLQPCDGGRRCRAMYLATEVWPTSSAELEEFSMDARSAPEGFARLISRISCRTSRGTLGLPGRRRDFQRQKLRNPARCHRIIVSGRTIVTASRTVGASRYSNTKIKRSKDVRAGRLGVLRRSTFNWWRSAITSPSSELLDRKRSRRIHLIRLKGSSTRRSSPDSGAQTKWTGFAIGTA